MKCNHDDMDSLRAVNPFAHPDAGDIVGAPPQSKEEPAWCRICGALWAKAPFGMGWGWMHPATDREASTLMNILREESDKEDNE